MAQAKATVDHDEIRRWVEARGGCPAHVKGSGDGKDPGIIRVDYSGFSGTHSLEEISWDEFFEAFEDNDLAFLYQDGKNTRFSKLISRDSAEIEENGQRPDKSKRNGGRAKGNGGKKAKLSGRRGNKTKVDAIDLLERQHREVEDLFDKLESAKSPSQKERVFGKLADALAAHARIEETLFYPAAFAEQTEPELREAVEEHLVAKRLIADLLEMDAADPQFSSKVTVLKEVIEHHVEEEEETLFKMVRKQDTEDLNVLGAKMQQRYKELMKSAPREAVPEEAASARAPF